MLFQEVWRASDASLLVRALPGWIATYVRGSIGSPKGGLVAFVRASSGWLARGAPQFHAYASSAPAWKIWEGDGLGGKGVQILDLERGSQRVLFAHTHLQSQYPGDDYALVRESQLAELHEIVLHLGKGIPIVIAGDFNTDWREPLYSRLTALGTDLTAQARSRYECGTVFDLRDSRATMA